MPKLTSRVSRLWGRPGDRGAVAALVALLLSGGVLLGFGALAVDVGLLYAEREQLQTGADAASVAVAKACVARQDRCTLAEMENEATDYAGQNSSDGMAGAAVCGRVPVTSDPIEECAEPQAANLTRCVGDRPVSGPYVEVRATTRVSGGGTLLPHAFAGALTGSDGATVAACSRVTWAPTLSATTPLGIAVCAKQFEAVTDDKTVFQPPPVAGNHDPAVDPARETALPWKSASDPDASCGGAPDGFMFIDGGAGTSCPHPLQVNAVGFGTSDAETPLDCTDELESLSSPPRPVPVSIYDSGAAGGQFTTAGIAMFVVTGWHYPSVAWANGPNPRANASSLSGSHLCDTTTNNTFCLYGYFTAAVVRDPGGALPAGDSYGAYFVRTIG